MSIKDNYINGFFDRLNQLETNHGSENADGSVTSEGNYTIPKDKVQLSPQRYTNLNELTLPEDKDFIKVMRDSIHQCVRIYTQAFPVVAESVRWATHGYAIKYDVGQSIGPHSDCSIPYEKDQITPISTFPMQNVLTCGLMLNNDYEGGELSYRPWGITTKAPAGSVVIYPSSYLGCHEVEPVSKGVRYAYLMWYGQGPINGVPHNVVTDLPQLNFNQKVVPVGQLPLYD
jgi:predicted 2-oxoglutarate/Fe(II)-dependent dioxygenase YbiX